MLNLKKNNNINNKKIYKNYINIILLEFKNEMNINKTYAFQYNIKSKLYLC